VSAPCHQTTIGRWFKLFKDEWVVESIVPRPALTEANKLGRYQDCDTILRGPSTDRHMMWRDVVDEDEKIFKVPGWLLWEITPARGLTSKTRKNSPDVQIAPVLPF